MQKQDKIVGIKANYYPEKRNFSEIGIKNFSFKKKIDYYKFIAYAFFKIKKKTHPQWLNLFYDFNLGKYDVLHFFNAVNLGNKPWITTFEFQLPRGASDYGRYKKENKYIHKVIGRLVDNSCKKIIAMSEFAKTAQINYLKDYDPIIAKKLIDKIEVIHPAQKLIINSIDEKPINTVPKFIFVGKDFFRKGGMEALLAFDELLSNGKKVYLKIVSTMDYGDHATQTTKDDVKKAFDIINKHAEITHHYRIENKLLLEEFVNSDVVLLPTYDDTYGYTVLEGQACGCPVITTNGGALHEINSNEDGWIIEVPLSENGRTIPRSESQKEIFIKNVVDGIINIVKEVIADKNLTKLKGAKALDRIKNNHNISKVSTRLETIYNESLS